MDKLKVKVRSAIKLDAKSLASLAKFVKSKYGEDCEIELKLDSELIAGYKLMVKGTEYDYSLSGSLDRLQEDL